MSLDPTLLAAGLPALGHICLVGAGPGAADLLTLRAVKRLAEADVVFYDRLVEPEVVALAGPQADKVFVGKEVGLHSWPQEKIDAAIVAAALSGKRVVRLKSGDPSVFGRACEEIEAARAAGIPAEIVPGVTAASAAAAQMLRPLTERGLTDRLVIATATCRPGEAPQRLSTSLTPGTTLALYMAMHRLHLIRDELLADGIPAETAVEIVSGAETRRQKMLATTLATVCEDVTAAKVGNPAIVFIRIPKPALQTALAEGTVAAC
ncbi:uroporphyrinogen-III C-methyltransferase [Frigidibacter sp. MR17.14]|uniref:uroporphyrinogen-III C-methyltransferase n=1 Tax=Frigidibacter sp. MR17.14 TaxID=3126509 RepID=UPI003012F7DC